MTIQITREDIQNPYVTTLSNPISRAIQRATGQWWYVFDGTTIRHMRSPLQPFVLPREVSRWWQTYTSKDPATAMPFEFELSIGEPA